ncbi:MAG TPA: proton-conducting transporter membrane subunit, partial [Spirochaetota bacterium]|nr:proton-conducting transporter membrane subunit [Spirochaetota bacterium]
MNSDVYGILLTAMGILLASSVIVPFAAGKRKYAGWLNFLFVTVAGVMLLNISYITVFGSSQLSQLLHFGPVGIYFMVDSFSGFFIAIIAFMAMISAFYSISYMEHYPEYSLRGFYVSYPLFILGMIGMVTVDDLSLGFTISWQLMTIASYFLVKFEYRKPEIVRGANKYLVLMELAWIFIIIGTFMVQGAGIGDSLHTIVQKMGAMPGNYQYLIYGLILCGFGFKAGIFPLGQLWLPDAHSVAPSPISALLSGVMLKTGVYGILRTFFWMVPHSETFHYNGSFWGILIASIGVVTLFIGTVQSMKQNDSKRLLAYSSIGQVGYIIFGIGAALFMFNTQSEFLRLLGVITIIGAVYHVLNHAVFKGLLFLTSGSVLFATGTKDLNRLGGLLKLMPVSAVLAGIAALSISGVPPFSGFASKWTLISSSLLAGSEVLFLLIFGIIALFTSAITLSCYVKFFGMTFTASGHEWNAGHKVKEVSAGMLLPKIVLAALCILQGLLPFVYFQTIIGVFQYSKGSIVYSVFNSINMNDHLFSSMMGVSVSVPG